MGQSMHLRIAARIAAKNVRSLVWEGDSLVDWVAGGNRFQLDGTSTSRLVSYAYRFDAACGSPSGRYSVIYESLGTKGLVLKEGEILREINRSFYHAAVYEYPVCFVTLASGRELLIHCPDQYNRLEIEDAETGERLTASNQRRPMDYFHSRLAAGPSGKHIMSAGWIWHPFDALGVYWLEDAIRDPSVLDGFGIFPQQTTEVSSAAFISERHILLASSSETFADDEDLTDANVLRPSSLAVWDIMNSKMLSQIAVNEPLGTTMPIGSDYFVSFYGHPKLVDVRTGQVIAEMTDVDSGKQSSSIVHRIERVPPLALDPQHRRFAIATSHEIVVGEILPES